MTVLVQPPPDPNIVDDPPPNLIEPPAPLENPDEKVIPVKTGDFKRIKDEARTKGYQQANAELDAKAKEAGFSSWAEALEAAAKFKSTPPPPTITEDDEHITENEEPIMPPKPINPPVAARPTAEDRLREENKRLAEERSKSRKQWRREEKARRGLQRELDAKDAEMGLREELYRFGVDDVDYGLRLLTRELHGKTEEEIAAFDRKAFFDGVRNDKPYLFKEKVTPATTGTDGGTAPGGGAPPPPPPGDPAAAAARSASFDARSAKPGDIQARLRALGLNPNV